MTPTPGFSEYAHPLGKHHLFTVGRDGDEQGNLGNVAIQIFDVSNPTQLRRRGLAASEGASLPPRGDPPCD